MNQIRADLLAWYQIHAREMPWRSQPTPWHVWVSEIMLQQTRVDSVIGYFERFIKRFPSPESVAAVPVEDVLDLWAGLGYYSRARNLHHACREIATVHGGNIPSEPDVFRTLKGVGAYTCGAVMSIAFGRPEAIVDGNVERVFSRVFLVEEDIRLSSTKKKFWTLAQDWVVNLTEGEQPGDLNQAVMELGALVCLPKSPRCTECPLQVHCRAFNLDRVHGLPVKSKAKPKRTVKKHAWLYETDDGRIWVTRRPNEGLLAGLWSLPMSTVETSESTAFALDIEPSVRIQHAFTHLIWQVDLYRSSKPMHTPKANWGTEVRAMTVEELSKVALGGPSLKALIKAGIPLPRRRGAGKQVT
ncbi:MAG: A/G-specific adenine glycosylase [Bradymonadia bacterium]